MNGLLSPRNTTQPHVNQEMKMNSESKATTKAKTKGNGSARQSPDPEQLDAISGNGGFPREQMIAEAAYFRAERRGFESGDEMADWLQAEVDVDGFLASEAT